MAPSSSRSSVIFDLDDDGDLDIVTNEMNDRPMVLISNLSARKAIHFLKVKLIGTTSNRAGIGPPCESRAGARTLTQFNDGKSGYLAQSSMPLYSDWARATVPARLRFSGRPEETDGSRRKIPRNALLTVREPAN